MNSARCAFIVHGKTCGDFSLYRYDVLFLSIRVWFTLFLRKRHCVQSHLAFLQRNIPHLFFLPLGENHVLFFLERTRQLCRYYFRFYYSHILVTTKITQKQIWAWMSLVKCQLALSDICVFHRSHQVHSLIPPCPQNNTLIWCLNKTEPNFIELLKPNKIMLSRIQLPAELPCHISVCVW